MQKLEEKDYDLNFLCCFTFDFQMLKEVLIKLAKSSEIMKEKMKQLEKANEEKDIRLSKLENQLNILNIPDDNSYSDSQVDKGEIKKEEKEKEEDKKGIKFEKIEIKKDKKFEKEKENESDKEEDKKLIHSRRSLESKKYLQKLENKNSFIQQIPQVYYEKIKSIQKLIIENSDKISNLEKHLTKKLDKALTDLEKNFTDLNTLNAKEHKIFEQKLKEIYGKLYDYNDKMDGIIVKTAPLDTLTIFKDNGNGNVDATKVMVKMLEEKVTKRIEIIENKNKGENNEDKFGQKMKELEDLINQINEELTKQKENNKFIKVDNDRNYDEEIQNLKDLIDKKYNDLLKIIEDLSIKIKNGDLVGDKLDELINKTKFEKENNISKNEGDNTKNKSLEIDNDIGNNITDLKNRIKGINNKLNDIDSYYKDLFNNSTQDVVEIKRKIKEMDSILESKITKNDLKAHINKLEEHSDIINFLQDTAADLNQSINKICENNPNFVKRLESLTHEVLQLKKRGTKESTSKPIDVNRFVDENKLKEQLKVINKKIEELMKDRNSLMDDVKLINDDLKLLETKERITKLEDEINNRLNHLLDKINKKYVDKSEINKYIKNIDIKIKSLDNQQKDSESWILAKQPIGCFNCASCESNIKNITISKDYIPWNKYPQADRQYHIGQGFSRLLQKIGNESKRNIVEKKEMVSDTELSNSIYFGGNMSNLKGNNGHFFFKTNNKDNLKEDLADNKLDNSKKYKLPYLKNRRKKNEKIPLTDDEEVNNNNSMDNANDNSPKILKISKKNINGNFTILNSEQKNVEARTEIYKMNVTSFKPKSKLERIRSLPIYENQ